MDREFSPARSKWCVVVADDHAPEWVAYGALELHSAPVQYSCLGGSTTLLHGALRRAASIAPASQILVTALEEYRNRWEPILSSVRPEMRFVGDKRTNSVLAMAAAILSIARVSPSNVVTILPARCYLSHEWILREALRQVESELPHVSEGVATLGMIDIDEGVDEDYMMVGRALEGRGLEVRGIARRPTACATSSAAGRRRILRNNGGLRGRICSSHGQTLAGNHSKAEESARCGRRGEAGVSDSERSARSIVGLGPEVAEVESSDLSAAGIPSLRLRLERAQISARSGENR